MDKADRVDPVGKVDNKVRGDRANKGLEASRGDREAKAVKVSRGKVVKAQGQALDQGRE